MARRVQRAASAGSPVAATGAVLPYDYGATFAITGRPGNIGQDVIGISPDGVFVAVAVGYGFEAERGRPLGLALRQQDAVARPLVLPGDLTLGEIPPSALIEGFRVNPRLEHLAFKRPGAEVESDRGIREHVFADQQVPASLFTEVRQPTLLERVKNPEEISFLFSIVDSSTGRELQDEPTHNLASLGRSNGERPFRLLAQPITFQPRSTIRLQIIERTEGITGTLFIVLFGYKILGSSACPETVVRTLTGPRACPVETIGRPSDRVIPFDYVTTIQLSGRPKNLVEKETTVSAEGGFVATSVGYGLLVEEQKVALTLPGRIRGVVSNVRNQQVTLRNVSTGGTTVVTSGASGEFETGSLSPGTYELRVPALSDNVRATIRVDPGRMTNQQIGVSTPATTTAPLTEVDLGELSLRAFSPSSLTDGIRIRPDLIRLAFEDNGKLASRLPIGFLGQLFEPLNRVEDVSFRYTIFDSGRGRELQNQPLHNVAGLGIASGDRPFKRLARPMVFLPRSTIRIQVEERFGRGRLFFVFQGYKILNPPGGTARA
jgi:hypothetical protein